MTPIDTNLRSLIKAISWRLVGTTDTIVISTLITGNLVIAFSIGASELISKTALYYIHERLWNRVSWGRNKNGPAHSRSLAKSISWRIIGTMDTVLLAYYFSGTIEAAVSIGGIELVTKITLYYLHERMWAAIRWGRLIAAKT